MQSKGLSRVFSNITVQKHQSFGAQLSLWSNSHLRASGEGFAVPLTSRAAPDLGSLPVRSPVLHQHQFLACLPRRGSHYPRRQPFALGAAPTEPRPAVVGSVWGQHRGLFQQVPVSVHGPQLALLPPLASCRVAPAVISPAPVWTLCRARTLYESSRGQRCRVHVLEE